MSKKKENNGFWSEEERKFTLSALSKEREVKELWKKAAEARTKAIRKQFEKKKDA